MECGESRQVQLEAGQISTITTSTGQPVHLEIREQGRNLVWRRHGDAAFQSIDLRPPRLGQVVVPLEGGDSLEILLDDRNPRPGSAGVTVHCRLDAETSELVGCIDAINGRGWTGWRWHVSMWSQPASKCRAFALHEFAARASARSDYADAITLYTRAAESWSRLGDAAREAAARLGLSERLADAGRYEDAIRAVEDAAALARRAAIPYFEARAESTRCIFLDDMGRLSQAIACLQPLPERYLAIGEVGDAVVMRYNLAAFNYNRGNVVEARRQLDLAQQWMAAASPRTQGLVALMDARISVAEGNFPAAMTALQRALEAAESTGNSRQRANALMEAAWVYYRLAAPAEARTLASEALAQYVRLGAPERIAAIWHLMARIDLMEGNRHVAAEGALEAARLFGSAGLDAEELRAYIVAARAGNDGAWKYVERFARDSESLHPWQQRQIEVARIQRSIRTADQQEAMEQASRLSELVGSAEHILDWIDLQHLQGQALIRAGEPDAARHTVENALTRHRRVTEAARLPSLRQMLLRQTRPLAAMWIDTVLATAPAARSDAVGVRKWLRWLHGADLLRPLDDDVRAADAHLDQHLALLFMPEANEDRQLRGLAQRSLLSLMASQGSTEAQRASTVAELEGDEPVLDGVTRLSYGFGEGGGLVVVERAGEVRLLPLPEATGMAQRVQQLLRLLQRRDAPVGEIEASARELAARILPPELGPPPGELWVDWDPVLAPLPFALLPWPGRDWPLVEDTAVSRRLGPGNPAPVLPEVIDLLVAARPSGLSDGQLPWLAVAEQEPGLVENAIPAVPVLTHRGRHGGRGRLQALLSTPGTWLHVAAHGVSHGGIQGLAGLWLEPEEDGGAPQFVSWIGLADEPLAADLVVLNACQLADNDAAASAAVSFSTALAAAGVRHVVAANWQLSDSASAVWVPAFYRTLAREGSPALALRQAQLALRRSRAFRHPFYWAGLGHLQGLPGATGGRPD